MHESEQIKINGDKNETNTNECSHTNHLRQLLDFFMMYMTKHLQLRQLKKEHHTGGLFL